MHLERYEIFLQSDGDETVYSFVSEGLKGSIQKAVVFTPTALRDFYNLGFGDVSPDTGEIDDLAVTDNGDTQIILATVAAIVVDYTARNPDAMIFATGSTPTRTRLYRRGISSNLADMEALFQIFGLCGDDWEPFQKGEDYDAFYVVRKK